jgi:hypothetical protein
VVDVKRCGNRIILVKLVFGDLVRWSSTQLHVVVYKSLT